MFLLKRGLGIPAERHETRETAQAPRDDRDAPRKQDTSNQTEKG